MPSDVITPMTASIDFSNLVIGLINGKNVQLRYPGLMALLFPHLVPLATWHYSLTTSKEIKGPNGHVIPEEQGGVAAATKKKKKKKWHFPFTTINNFSMWNAALQQTCHFCFGVMTWTNKSLFIPLHASPPKQAAVPWRRKKLFQLLVNRIWILFLLYQGLWKEASATNKVSTWIWKISATTLDLLLCLWPLHVMIHHSLCKMQRYLARPCAGCMPLPPYV